jgi:hypothetical protein
MAEMKRKASSALSSDERHGASVDKRQRITDFFAGRDQKKKASMESLHLKDMPEPAILKLEAGNSTFRELRLDRNGSFLSYYPSLANGGSTFSPEKLSALKKLLLLEPGGAMTTLPWSQGRVKVFGKEHLEKRYESCTPPVALVFE